MAEKTQPEVQAKPQVNPEKLKVLSAVMDKIEKDFGKGSIMKLGENTAMNVEAVSTGSIGLDCALGIGGVPKGRIIEIYGPESSGKTTIALHVVAEAQKTGGDAAYIDVEHALDPVYAKALGVDIDSLLAKALFEPFGKVSVEARKDLLAVLKDGHFTGEAVEYRGEFESYDSASYHA